MPSAKSLHSGEHVWADFDALVRRRRDRRRRETACARAEARAGKTRSPQRPLAAMNE